MATIDTYAQDLMQLAAYAWEHPEPGFRETACSASQVEYLRKQGFAVATDAARTKTGYVACWGSGKPVIAFLGEFDALWGLQQQADATVPMPLSDRAMGQGCGHHLLGVGAIGAGLLYRDYLLENHLPGTVRIYGCPGEESGSGKAYMAREGLFDDCDAAITWHPSNFNMVVTGSTQSCIQCYFRFTGIPAHAAGAPHLGRSALDAVELMNVGVNYLREHMLPSDRVHYAITDPGGSAPNVVQARAEVRYFVRSATNPACEQLFERVQNIARGAALMTGTEVEIVFDEGLSNTVPNFTLEEVMDRAFRELGVPEYTDRERAYAKAFKDTVQLLDMLSDVPQAARDPERLTAAMEQEPLCDFYVETNHSDLCEMGSTDVGDVSWVTPTVTANLNCFSFGAGAHSWQWVAQGKSSIASKGMLRAGEIMARTARLLQEQPDLLTQARQELNTRLRGDRYRCPIPKGVWPHYFD